MFKVNILICLLLLPMCVFPQSNTSGNFDFKVSKPYGVIDALCKDYISDGNEILLVKSDHTWITLQKFNSESLEMTGFKEFKNLPYFSTEEIIKCKDKFYFFYSVWDKPNVTEQLFVKEIDIKNCDFSKEGTLLLKVKGHISADPLGYVKLDVGPAFGIGTGTKFHISLSNDESKFLVQYRIKPEEKDDNLNSDVIGTYVYDNSFNKLRGQEYKMPYTEAKMDNLNYLVTNSGEIFMLVRVIDDVNKKTGETFGHFELMKCKEGSDEINSTRLDLENVYFNFTEIYEDALNKVVCLGHHNTKNTTFSQGLSLVKINPNGKLIDTKTFKIPTDVIHQYDKKPSNKVWDNEGLAYLNIDSRVNCVDSSMIVLEEQYHTEIVATSKSSHYVYYFEDILVSKITSYGKLEWVKRIPKEQAGARGRGSLSYIHLKNNDNQFVLFLDNIKNLDFHPEDLNRLMDGKGGYLIAYRISNNTGEMERIPLFDITNVNGMELLQFTTKRFCQVSDNDVIIEAYKGGKQDVLVKIHLE